MSATTETVEAAGAEVESLLDEQQWTGKIFSGGWVDAPVQIETSEPATGEVLGTAGGGDPETIARAAKSPRRITRSRPRSASSTWPLRSSPSRSASCCRR